MLSRLISNLITLGVYLVGVPICFLVLLYHMTRWCLRDIERAWRS